MKRLVVAFVAASASLLAVGHAQTIKTERVASGLSVPIFATAPANDFNRMFVVERGGAIKILNLTNNQVSPTPFLTIPVLTGGASSEQGLLGMAFDPNYATNGRFFVNYTRQGDGATVIARYQANGPNFMTATTANPAETLIMTYAQPQSNHNGGWLGFGPNDGLLYISSGDGGGSDDNDTGHDPNIGNGQALNTRLGKILRIDVSGAAFTIPNNNPFAPGGATPNPANEQSIWAYGLRNPWRPAFDRQTGDLYIADVGQNAREEVNFQPANSPGGVNYGWRSKEGTLVTGQNPPPNASMVDPIHEYFSDPGGHSITGGYVYRGSLIPSLQGTYFFADAITDNIASFRWNGTTKTELTDRTTQLEPPGTPTYDGIVSFAEDARGEMYIIDFGNGTASQGEIFKIVPEPSSVLLLLVGAAVFGVVQLMRRAR